MYEYIRGELSALPEGFAVVEAGGIGYRIHISSRTATALGGTGEQVRLLTDVRHREDQLELVGFLEESERELYRRLLKVSGIGWKLALTILSGLAPADFARAVQHEDLKMLTAVPGLGRKTAEKLVFELKGALDELAQSSSALPPAAGTVNRDAEAALEALGFPPLTARAAVAQGLKESGAAENVTLQQLITAALRHVQ